jgi:hypothetical protein
MTPQATPRGRNWLEIVKVAAQELPGVPTIGGGSARAGGTGGGS